MMLLGVIKYESSGSITSLVYIHIAIFHQTGTDALIWVVDSVDVEKFQESKEVLAQTIKDPEILRDIPVLVVASKSDVPGA